MCLLNPLRAGVAVIFKNTFVVKELFLTPPSTTFEHIMLRLRTHAIPNERMTIGLCYRSGSSVATDPFFDEFESMLIALNRHRILPIIIGDLNIWVNDPTFPPTVKFNKLMTDYILFQSVSQPTHNDGAGNTLDLIKSRNLVRPFNVEVFPTGGWSDHCYSKLL